MIRRAGSSQPAAASRWALVPECHQPSPSTGAYAHGDARLPTTCRLLAIGCWLPLLCASAACQSTPAPKTYPSVTIHGRTWPVEVAETSKKRYQGLSGRTNLSPRTGMLFIFPQPRVLDFCMRGCPKAIDIAFIDAGRKVVKIHTMQPEPDLGEGRGYSSVVPAQYALETAGGALFAAGVKVGDTVTFSADVPEAAKAEPDR